MDKDMTKFFGDWAMEAIDSPAPEVKPQQSKAGMEVKELPVLVFDGRNIPYCAIKTNRTKDGHKEVSAYLHDEILDVDEYVQLIDELFTATPDDRIYIYIDSPGGFVSAGSIISSAIASCKGEVYTVARGLCASAACLIHNSAKPGHAIVADMGVLMIHMSSHMDAGTSSLIAKRAADQTRYVNETLLSQAVEMGYLSGDELQSLQTGNEIFISAKDFRERTAAKQRGGSPEQVPTDSQTVQPTAEAGTESWGIDSSKVKDMFPALEASEEKMVNPAALIAKERLIKANALRIRTTDHKTFRVYIPSDLQFSRTFTVNFSLFLDGLNSDQTVELILGAKLADATAVMVGSVISAIQSCEARVIAVAAGYMSIPETMIWCFCKERKVLRYGALTFGVTEVIKHVDKYKDYFNTFLNRAVEIGMLNEQEAKDAMTNFMTKFITYNDLHK